MNFSPGERIGDYELRSFCGGGAYGEVFSAVNTLTGERVALKILHRAPKILERELRGVLHYRDCRNVHLIRIRHVEQFRESGFAEDVAVGALDGVKGEPTKGDNTESKPEVGVF